MTDGRSSKFGKSSGGGLFRHSRAGGNPGFSESPGFRVSPAIAGSPGMTRDRITRAIMKFVAFLFITTAVIVGSQAHAKAITVNLDAPGATEKFFVDEFVVKLLKAN
jgi:hypothetical protein